MKAPSSLALGALLAASVALVGCADHSLVNPVAPRADEALLDESAGPDSGEIVLYASDGPAAPSGLRTMAIAAPQTIRIGVVQSASSVTLGSGADYTVSDKATGLTLMTGSNGSVSVSLASVVTVNYRLQVMCGSAAAVATRKAAAEAAGHKTLTAFNSAANCTRLYIGEFASNASFSIRNAYRNQLIAAGLAATDSFWSLVSIGSSAYAVQRGTTTLTNVNPIVVTSSSGLVTIGGTTYRGKAEARQNSSGGVAGINELPLEQYLYGVVPKELPPTSLWGHPEAQKTQAVAARTYARRGLGKRGADGYDLRATTDDQVYGGYAAEQPVSSAAVDATAGVVATYDGALIDALFSSTSGGHTADSEEAFSSVLPYLRGVPDRDADGQWDNQADKTLEKFLKDDKPKLLLKEQKGDYEVGFSTYYRWTYEWTMDEMSGLISALAGQPVGRVLEVNITKRGPSGRALEVQYVTETGTFTSGKDGSTRAALKYRNASGAVVSLPSTRIFIEPTYEHGKSGPVTGYRVYGAGFGHGVGMSQTGAAGMAQAGYTYDQILKHYYTGIELTAPQIAAVP
jgi:stage II sporulation protein D